MSGQFFADIKVCLATHDPRISKQEIGDEEFSIRCEIAQENGVKDLMDKMSSILLRSKISFNDIFFYSIGT